MKMGEERVDQALVQQTIKGDREAFDILMRKYEKKMIQIIHRYIRDPSETMDVAQETFIQAYCALPSFRGDCVFYTWLYRIAVNTAKNHIKSRDRKPLNMNIDIMDAEMALERARLHNDDTPEKLLYCREVEAMLLSAVNALPESLRISIVLHELAGLNYHEIASMLNCPVGTIRSRIFRARTCVEQRLESLLKS